MPRLSDYLTAEEMKSLCQTSNLVGCYRVGFNFALIALCFSLVAFFPEPITWFICTFIMGGRILGLGILNHDAGHHTLFHNLWLNRFVGRWLLGSLILIDYDAYREGHLKHHTYAGSEKDPDLIFVEQYPVSKASLIRKFARDLFGITAIKELAYQVKVSTWYKRIPTLFAHSCLFGLLYFANLPWAYGLFWCGYFFAYPLFSRIRIMGEHGAMANRFNMDPRYNTRSTLAGPLEKLLIAPNDVHFHLEHHLNPKIPAHKLEEAHFMLRQRGYYIGFDCVEMGYMDVIKKCIGKNATPPDQRKKPHAPSAVANMS